MKHKVLALFLSLVMTLAMVPAVAFAAQSHKITFHITGEGYVYARGIATDLKDGDFVTVEQGQSVVLYAKANSRDYEMKTIDASGVSLTWAGSAARMFDMPNNDVDVYLTFGLANYKTVYFNANGGTGTMSPASVSGDSYVLPECTFEAPAGKVFEGWSKDPNGPAFPNQVMGISSDPTTLYAIWKDKAPTHTVKVVIAGQGRVKIATTQGYLPNPLGNGEYALIEQGERVRVYAVPDGEEYEYREMHSNRVEMEWAGSAARVFDMPEWDITIYVTFCDRSKYTVSFDANGGSGVMTPEVDVTSPYVPPAKCLFAPPSGMEFDGWSRTPNGPEITSDDISITKDTTLYARWKPRSFWIEEYTPGFYLICKRGSYTGNNAAQFVRYIGNAGSIKTPMYYVPDYDAWCILTSDRQSLATRNFREQDMGSASAKWDLMVPKPAFSEYGLAGDVNGNGDVNIVDAQMAFNMACGALPAGRADGIDIDGWLAADVNGDTHVDAADARAIQCRVIGGVWG